MEALLLLSALLQSLSTVADNGSFGDKSKVLANILKLADMALQRGGEATEELRKLVAEVQSMANVGMQPTEEQWLSLKDRSDAAHAVLNPS